MPAPLVDQLAPGGRLVIPVGADPREQVLVRVHRDGHGGLGPRLRLAAIALALGCGGVAAAGPPPAVTPLAASQAAEELRRHVEQLRETGAIAVAGERIASGTRLPEFYEARGFAPAWSRPGALEELLRAVRGAGNHGLDPAHYRLEALARLAAAPPPAPAAAAELDLLATDALLRLARHLRSGKVEPAEREPPPDPEPAGAAGAGIDLEALLAAGDLAAAVDALAPAHHVYRGLVQSLARYREIRDRGGFPPIGEGPALRRDQSDPRIPALRRRLAMSGDLAPAADPGSPLFDETLEQAVRRFQHRHGLNEDGVVGESTRAALELPVEERIEQIRINLERARWIVHRLPAAFVAVNVAGQRLYLVRGGAAIWETRVIVGKAATRTPVFSAPMRYLVLNPEWAVPRSIVGEVLADARRDPSYLARQGFRVLDAEGRTIDPATVELERWRGADFPYAFRQGSGPANALGRIKLVFPNPYSVYLHDTPARSLFEREQRTFSHGCIRVQEPLRLAELVLDDPERWSREVLEAAIATGKTRTVPVEPPLPVLVLYWTAATDLHGELHFYRDVYGRDPALLRALDES